MAFRAVRGMKDILPDEVVHWQRLEDLVRRVVRRYGFGEVRTPLLETTELFVREIGEGTDVVDKEMYSFERHNDHLTVRPEGTAGAARAYVQHGVAGRQPISRWFYLGPMFRAERPAKGRFRQFHQAGCEIYGDPGPYCDAELIHLSATILREAEVGDFVVLVNSLGSGDTRARYRDAVAAYFAPYAKDLSEESQRRLETNPLRILDSKSEQDQRLVAGAPSVLELLDSDDRAHFDTVVQQLDALDIPYRVEPKLVRGLDYYTRTLFEVQTTGGSLGAQAALIGGGRYDRMIQNLGSKKPIPAIGFGMGIERVLSLMPETVVEPSMRAYIAPLNEAAIGRGMTVAAALRDHELQCEIDARGQSLKSMMRRANNLGAAFCVLIGDTEVQDGTLTVKDLNRKTQETLSFDDALAALKHGSMGDGSPKGTES